MGLIIATVRNQRSYGTGAEELTEDIRFDYNAHAIHHDVFALKDSGTAATVQNLIGDKVTTIRLNTTNGTPETTIRSDDLHDWMVLSGIGVPYHSILTSTDNIPHGYSLLYPLSPFPNDPTKNFGMPANKGVQFVGVTAANVSQDFDNYTYDLTVEGLSTSDKPSSLGYVRVQQDSYTSGAVNSTRDTVVGAARRLLGVLNFETTSFEDLAASAAIDVTGIRTQEIAYSENTQFRYRPARSWSMMPYQIIASFAASASVINILDEGRFWSDFGMMNANPQLGIDIAGQGTNVKVKTIAGVASEATRVNPVALVV
jgi:hypothetical protein